MLNLNGLVWEENTESLIIFSSILEKLVTFCKLNFLEKMLGFQISELLDKFVYDD